MTTSAPLALLIEALAKECLLCGGGPNRISALGHDAIVVEDCGHSFGTRKGADAQNEAVEFDDRRPGDWDD